MRKLKLPTIIIFSLGLISFNSGVYKFNDIQPLKLYLPDDLKVELWAETPMLYNPTNMDTDSKGRIWVTEGVNYRNFNNDSSTFFHHNGGDRIVILSDTNQDGKADKSHVFVQDKDLVAPLGIAVLGNEIMVSCAPYLIKYTDENGDDKPDKKEIFLKGFGGHDHDHSLHSIVAGPDGRLHFNVGNAGPHTIMDKSGFTVRSGSLYVGGTPYNLENSGKRVSDDGKTYVGGLQMSINPDGTGLKVLGHNFRNSYETYVDGQGDMWQNDNDDQVVTCRVSWLAEGGNAGYFSNDGTRYWSADQQPDQNMFVAHWHQDDPGFMPAGDNSGAGSPTGMLRIEGDGLGQKYRGMVLSADAGRNVLFSYFPKKTNSGYNLSGGKNIFLSSNPTDDPSYQWNNKDFTEDKTKWFRPSDMLIGTDGALYVADWYDAVVGGHQIKDKNAFGRIYRISPKNKKLTTPKISFETLASKMEGFKNPAINVRYQAYLQLLATKNIDAIIKLTSDTNPFTKSRAIWLLAEMGEKGKQFVKKYLNSIDENERIVAFRALRNSQSKEELLPIINNITNDKSAFVRREAILALQNYDYSIKKNLLVSFANKIPIGDKFYANALKLALFQNEDDFYDSNKAWFQSKFDLLFALHPKNAVSALEKIAQKPTENFSKRKQAITAIGYINTQEAVKSMFNLKASKEIRISELASYWLSFRSNNHWRNLHEWKNEKEELEKQNLLTKSLNQKEKILNADIAFWDRKNATIDLSKTQTGGQILLDLIAKNLLSEDIVEITKPLLLNNSDANIKFQARNLIGTDIEIYNEKEIIKLKGNNVKGGEIFKNQCISCHKLGNSGVNIGPDLSKIHDKLDKTGLFEAINYPSSSIVFGFESYTITTKNGNTFYGFILSENENNITLKDLTGKSINIAQNQVKSKIKDKKSIMPSIQTSGLKANEVSDLLEFLAEKK
jgi:putative membrane-bound dehydrogenase-like protein